MKFPELILLLIHYVTEVDRAKISNILQCYGPYQAWGNHKSKQRVYRIIATGSRDPRIDCFAKVGVHTTSKNKIFKHANFNLWPNNFDTLPFDKAVVKLLPGFHWCFPQHELQQSARVSGTIARISPVMRLQEPESNKKSLWSKWQDQAMIVPGSDKKPNGIRTY